MMYTIPPKKLIIINILDILNRYTDAEHTLSQKEIQQKLESEYSMKVDRKAVKRNLMNLIDCGYPIEYSETPRTTLNKKTGEYEENNILSDFYIEREFDNSELRLLIDSIVFSSHIPQRDKMRLIEKLEGLSNVYFKTSMKHVATAQSKGDATNALFYTIEVLNEAIGKGKQVKFHYDEYGTDKKLHHRKNSEGEVREYIINPYQIAATNGRYYLVCNYDKYDNVAHIRIDKMSDVQILDEKAKPMRQVQELSKGLDLPRHMAEHMYMFSGPSIPVKLETTANMMSNLVDWFGKDFRILKQDGDKITVRVVCNEQAMRYWALQYGPYVEVLEPESLRTQLKADVEEMWNKYK